MQLFLSTVLSMTSLVVADWLERIPRQTPASQRDPAVLFFASCEGTLREIEYDPIIFNQLFVNQGSAYNNYTGVFTAPVAGIYQFVFSAQLCRSTHNNHWYFVVNKVSVMPCLGQVSGGDTSLSTHYFMEELKKGDQVWMKQRSGSCAWASTISRTINFSGALLASQGVSRVGGKYDICPPPSRGRNWNVVSRSEGHSKTPSCLAVSLLLCWFLLL